MRKLILWGIIFIMLFSLVACDSVNLNDYKAKAKITIQDFADERQNDYGSNNWQTVCNIVADCEDIVDLSKNKTNIDIAVNDAKESIDKVIKLMSGAEDYSEGNGTEHNPYIISNRGQLIHFSNQVNDNVNASSYFALGTDIDLEGMEWMPIGIIDHYYGDDVFSGVFDGKGYEISNFCITIRNKNPRASTIGLFGCSAGTIKNIGVTGFDINIVWGSEIGFILSAFVGGLAGRNLGNIANCYAFGNISLEYNGGPQIAAPAQVYAGGLVGHGDGNLINSYAATNISAKNTDQRGMAYAAGLVNGGNAKNCFATGNVSTDTNPSDSALPIGVNDGSCFAYDGQEINSFILGPQPFTCSSDELNDPIFYADRLGWDEVLWNFEDLLFFNGKYADGKYPKLKKIVNNAIIDTIFYVKE